MVKRVWHDAWRCALVWYAALLFNPLHGWVNPSGWPGF